MKRVLFGILSALLALSFLAACQTNPVSDSDDNSRRTTPVQSVTTQLPPPITVTEPPKPHTTVYTATTTELPHPSTSQPITTTQPTTQPPVTTTAVVTTTTGTGPVVGENDNQTDWGPIVPMDPTPATTAESAPLPTPDTGE